MCVLQGAAGGERSSSESAPYGVRNCKHICVLSINCVFRDVLKLHMCFVCTQILPGVRVIIVNPETKGPLGDSHLGEVTGHILFMHSLHIASSLFFHAFLISWLFCDRSGWIALTTPVATIPFMERRTFRLITSTHTWALARLRHCGPGPDTWASSGGPSCWMLPEVRLQQRHNTGTPAYCLIHVELQV